MKDVMDIVMWLILASIAVLVVMNASGTAQIISATTTGAQGLIGPLTGSGYKKPS